jgi:hypothetical protein
MTRAQVLDRLTFHVNLLRETQTGDALADLLNLAYPDNPPFPGLGFGDGLPVIRSAVESILDGWTRVGRLNTEGATPYREAALALAFVLGRAEEAALQGAS